MNIMGAVIALAAVAVAFLPHVPPPYPAMAGGAASIGLTLAGRSTEAVGWLVAEVVALLVLTLLAARHTPAAALVPGLAVPFIVVGQTWDGPLTFALQAAAAWALPAIAAAAAGLYLRWLDGNRRYAVARAVQDQRLALARDLHDFVAHDVSGMLVQAQAAALAPDLPAPVAEALRRIEQGGQRALASLDRTVHANSPAPDLRRLAEEFDVEVELQMDDLPREASATAYRIVTEALTNVRRHAPNATKVGVQIVGKAGGISVRVEDDGGGHSEAARRGGYGLAGLAELLAQEGGSLEAGPHGAGWLVEAVIPA